MTEPCLGLPSLGPSLYSVDDVLGAVGTLGHIPDGVHWNKEEYEAEKKRYILENWWCRSCHDKAMAEMEERMRKRHG
jgi:hypothetical protein